MNVWIALCFGGVVVVVWIEVSVWMLNRRWKDETVVICLGKDRLKRICECLNQGMSVQTIAQLCQTSTASVESVRRHFRRIGPGGKR